MAGIQGALRVHNLQTERGVYVAAGVLVHNCQLFAASTFFKVVDPFRAKRRYGVSADNRRKDRKEFLTKDLFGDVIEDIPLTDVEKSGSILDVEVRVVPTEFRADWYGMPSDGEGDDEPKELDTDRLQREMMADGERDLLAVGCVEAELDEGRQVLVMVTRREHCRQVDRQLVARGVKTGFLIGGADYREEFVRTRAGMLSGERRVGVGTVQAIGTGIDLPAVGSAVVGVALAGNRQLFNQVRGRVCRASKKHGKTTARMYYLWDRKVFGLRHLRNIVKWNRTVVVRGVNGEWIEGKAFLKNTEETAP